jgi:protein ImuA
MTSIPRRVSASSAATPSALLERLRRTLGAAEASTGLALEGEALLALGIPIIDGALGGGLRRGMLHEIAAAREIETTAATAFALALAARHDRIASPARSSVHPAPPPTPQRRVLSPPVGKGMIWIAEDLSLAENGAPYGPGLDEAGIAPEHLIRVATRCNRDTLWAMEEALRCRPVGVVIGELRTSATDQVATRRLALAAAAGNTLGLVLRTVPDDGPSVAATRWMIGAAGPGSERWGVGPPRLAVHLMRNRNGHLGAWIVEWDSVEQRFELASHSQPVAGSVLDRSYRAAVA